MTGCRNYLFVMYVLWLYGQQYLTKDLRIASVTVHNSPSNIFLKEKQAQSSVKPSTDPPPIPPGVSQLSPWPLLLYYSEKKQYTKIAAAASRCPQVILVFCYHRDLEGPRGFFSPTEHLVHLWTLYHDNQQRTIISYADGDETGGVRPQGKKKRLSFHLADDEGAAAVDAALHASGGERGNKYTAGGTWKGWGRVLLVWWAFLAVLSASRRRGRGTTCSIVLSSALY